MAYDAALLINLGPAGRNRKMFNYETTADTLKTIASATATTYFGVIETGLDVDDLLYIKGSDAEGNFRVSAVGTNSTTLTLVPLGAAVGEVAVTTGNLPPYGVYHSTAASGQISILDMPWGVGQEVRIVSSVSTSWTINSASTAVGSFNSTGVSILINAPNQSVHLIGESTARWLIAGQSQPGTAIIGPLYS